MLGIKLLLLTAITLDQLVLKATRRLISQVQFQFWRPHLKESSALTALKRLVQIFRFNYDDKNVIEECKHRVVYVPPRSSIVKIEEESEETQVRGPHVQALQSLREKLAHVVQQNKLLQQELKMLRRNSRSRTDESLSLTFAVGLIGLLIGIILNLALSRRCAA